MMKCGAIEKAVLFFFFELNFCIDCVIKFSYVLSHVYNVLLSIHVVF